MREKIQSDEMVVYEVLPGFRYDVWFRFDEPTQMYVVEGEAVDDFNLKFNPESVYTFDNFSQYLVNERFIIESMKKYADKDLRLRFVVCNSHTLSNTDYLDYFAIDEIQCIGVFLDGNRMKADAYKQFCKENGIAAMHIIFQGNTIANESDIKQFMSFSKFSRENYVYSIIVEGTESEYSEEFSSALKEETEKDRFTNAIIQIDSFVADHANGAFYKKYILDRGKKTSNVTRIYSSLVTALESQEEYPSIRSICIERLKLDQKKFEKLLRSTVRTKFRSIISQVKDD